MNGTIKLVAPLLAALAVAACNAGGNSNLPVTAGQSSTQSQRSNSPEWQAKNLATAACPQVKGVPACMALIQSKSGISPDVAGWAPADFQARYHLPSSTNGSGQIVAIVDAYDNPNVASDLAAYRSQFGLGTAPLTSTTRTASRATILEAAPAGASRSTST
ncbi:MAG: hypothetical protein WB609_10825 [Candidatus Cybelea sp.]